MTVPEQERQTAIQSGVQQPNMIGVLAHTSLQKAHASYRHHLKTMLPLLLVAAVAVFFTWTH